MRLPRVPGVKLAPLMLALDAAMVARDHWGRLDPRDRRELSRIVRASRGRPQDLSAHDRAELLRIVRALDLITAGRRLLPFHGGVSRRRR